MKLINSSMFKRYLMLTLLILIAFIFYVSLYDVMKLQTTVDLIFSKMKSISNLNSNKNIDEEKVGEIRNVFIDLGANKGDSIYNFVGLNSGAQGGDLNNPVFPQSYKTAKWIIYGFEANSFFDDQLVKMKQDVENMGHSIHLFKSTAAWIYDGTIDFYLDTVNKKKDFWGSSLNNKHVIIIFLLNINIVI